MIAVITPQFENTEYSVPEDGGSVEICIAIQPDQLEREVVVTLQTVDDTATGTYMYVTKSQQSFLWNKMYSSFMSSESQDYTAVNVDVTLSPSTLQACTNISITDDSEPEDDETFTVTVVPSDDVDPGPDTRITIDDNGQRSP